MGNLQQHKPPSREEDVPADPGVGSDCGAPSNDQVWSRRGQADPRALLSEPWRPGILDEGQVGVIDLAETDFQGGEGGVAEEGKVYG